MLGSALIGLRNKISGNKKNLADKHTKALVSIMDEINGNNNITHAYIKDQKINLQNMLSNVIKELDDDQLTTEGFHFFSFTWDKANELLRDKERFI